MCESIDKYIIPRFLLNEIYPYSEGIQLEFKKSFHINQHYKYRETICAFLNTQGGLIIYGIDDNCQILGCYLTDKEKVEKSCLRKSVDFLANMYAIKRDKAAGKDPKAYDVYDAKYKLYDGLHK